MCACFFPFVLQFFFCFVSFFRSFPFTLVHDNSSVIGLSDSTCDKCAQGNRSIHFDLLWLVIYRMFYVCSGSGENDVIDLLNILQILSSSSLSKSCADLNTHTHTHKCTPREKNSCTAQTQAHVRTINVKNHFKHALRWLINNAYTLEKRTMCRHSTYSFFSRSC